MNYLKVVVPKNLELVRICMDSLARSLAAYASAFGSRKRAAVVRDEGDVVVYEFPAMFPTKSIELELRAIGRFLGFGSLHIDDFRIASA